MRASSAAAAYHPLQPQPSGSLPGLVIAHGPALLASAFLALTVVLSLPIWPHRLLVTHPKTDLSRVTPLPRSIRNNLALAPSTCEREFPLFYPQLEEQTRYWKRRGGISSTDIDQLERAAASQSRWGWARVIIRDGRLYIRALRKGPDTRLVAMLMLLHDAVSSDPGAAMWLETDTKATSTSTPLPPIDLILSVGDKDGFPGAAAGPAWVLTKSSLNSATEGNWLSPDFGFAGWPEARTPSYEEVVDLNMQVEETVGSWDHKDNRAFWRGFPNVYAIRADLLSRTKAASLLPAEDPNAWADIFPTTFGSNEEGTYKALVPIQEHCSKKYLVHAEGNSYSGRDKYLYNCHSVVITHKLEWIQHFHPALISDASSPAQNHVQVPGPMFEGLEEAVRGMWEADGDNKANAFSTFLNKARTMGMLGELTPKEIADNARDSLRDRYLTPAATACYYRAALGAYASLQKTSTWSATGPEIRPGNGLPPQTNGDPHHINSGVPPAMGQKGSLGDISFLSWSLIRSQANSENTWSDWPPSSL